MLRRLGTTAVWVATGPAYEVQPLFWCDVHILVWNSALLVACNQADHLDLAVAQHHSS